MVNNALLGGGIQAGIAGDRGGMADSDPSSLLHLRNMCNVSSFWIFSTAYPFSLSIDSAITEAHLFRGLWFSLFTQTISPLALRCTITGLPDGTAVKSICSILPNRCFGGSGRGKP